MPPNQDEAVFEVATTEPAVPLILVTPQSSEASFSLSTDSDYSISFDAISLFATLRIPLEQNLRELLLKVTETDDLQNVTQVKLRVIARDVSLQHLNVHTPVLQELILDGSVISSLRDLGCRLRCLKVLKVNRCGLTSFDGLFGLETLEELYAGFNCIEDVSPCSHLPDIKVIDVRNNNVAQLTSVSFLGLCETLQHLVLSGNDVAAEPNYRETVKKWLPNLKTLDGVKITAHPDTHEAALKRQDSNSSNTDDENPSLLNVCFSELKQVSFEDDNSARPTPSTSLPPINLPNFQNKRPATTGTINSELLKNQASLRPATCGSSKPVNATQLPDILLDSRKQAIPSSLTSGEPICGNIAVSLRNRFKSHEAWSASK